MNSYRARTGGAARESNAGGEVVLGSPEVGRAVVNPTDSDTLSERAASEFQRGYYGRQYTARRWRQRGDHPILYRALIRMLRPWRGRRLLDVGCGEGHFLRRCDGQFERYGVDISEEGVATTRRTTGLQTVHVASAEKLPYPDRFFDVAACLDVVEHLPQPELALRELYRVLAPDGCLVLSTPNPESLGSRIKGRESFIFSDPTHVSVKTMDEWRSLLAKAGFSVLRDGSDTLWDAPYFSRLRRAQWFGFLALAQIMWAFRPMYPWELGENYVCFARRPS